MPFKSEAQRKWMHANKPEMAKKWEKHTPKGKKLPKKVKKKSSKKKSKKKKTKKESFIDILNDRLVLFEESKPKKSGFHVNIEKETKSNTDYRRVLFTSGKMQLVLMSIEPGGEIGMESHDVDQFIRVDGGSAKAIIDNSEYKLVDGDAIIVPANVKHNVINIGNEDLKIYTVYTPPQHQKDTVQKTKADEAEEHFDGETDL